jgi:hypothetical protein
MESSRTFRTVSSRYCRINSVEFSVFSLPSVLKPFPGGAKGFTTEGTEKAEKAKHEKCRRRLLACQAEECREFGNRELFCAGVWR